MIAPRPRIRLPRRGRRGRRGRAGLTLVEVVVTMSAGTVLLMLAAGLLHSLLRLDRGARALVADDARLDRLARIFRDDAHAATAFEQGGADRLALALPGGESVEYRVAEAAVVRTLKAGDAAPREERFKLPAKGTARLEVSREGPTTVLRLVVSRGPGRVASSGLRAEAVLGRDRRFSGGGDE